MTAGMSTTPSGSGHITPSAKDSCDAEAAVEDAGADGGIDVLQVHVADAVADPSM